MTTPPRIALVLFAVSTLAARPEAQCPTTVLLNELPSGTNGPRLSTPDGAPVIGGPFSLRIEGAEPNAAGALVFSGSESPFFEPAYGATFWFGPIAGQNFFMTDSDGRSPMLSVVPELDPAFCGGFAVFQGGVFDRAAVGGVAVTNAVRLLVGAPNALPFGRALESNPTDSMLLVDLDEDGELDLVTARDSAGSVLVQLGSGGGDFAPGTSWSVGISSPTDLAVADMNGDGDPDLVVTNRSSAPLTVLFGDGAGGFLGSSSAFGSIGTESALALSDLNADGQLDALVAGSGSTGGVSRFLGFGAGTFAFPTVVHAGGTNDLALTDLDEDGLSDLVLCSSEADELGTRLGNGDGTFAAAQVFPAGGLANDQPVAIAVADLDGDTLLDVAAAVQNPGAAFDPEGTLTVLLGDGAGGLGAPTIVADIFVPTDVLAAELDGVLGVDLVATGGTNDELVVFRAAGGGTFAAPERYATGSGPEVVIAGDVDQDGLQDLLVGGAAGHLTLIADASGGFLGTRLFPTSIVPISVRIADLNEDGAGDVVSRVPNGFVVQLGTGDGGLGTPAFYTPAVTSGLAIGDLNGDGFDDVVARDSATTGASVWLNDGSGGFALDAVYPTGVSNVSAFALADLDGDQVLDVLCGGSSGSTHMLLVWPGVGDGTLGTLVTYATVLGGSPRAEHLDGDGFLDVFFAHTFGFEVLLNDGTGALAAAVDYAGGVDSTLADLNGDGFPDVLSSQFSAVRYQLNAGDGTFGPITLGAAISVNSFAVLDLDGDGVLDLVGPEGQLLVSLGNGDGTFSLVQVLPAPPGGLAGFYLEVLDANGDGDEDVMGLEADGTLLLFESLGDGTLAPPVRYPGGLNGRAFGDLDGDGIPDAVLAPANLNVGVLVNRLGE